MRTQLIKLEDYNIIVSDEYIKERDWKFDIDMYLILNPHESWFTEITDVKRIIASENPEHNLPSIDYNGLEEQFGIVDIEKLAKEYCENLDNKLGESWSNDYIELPKRMAEFAQSLNVNKFSLDDVVQIVHRWEQNIFHNEKDTGSLKAITEFIQSLQQPKVFDIEIETELINKFGQKVTYEDLDYPEITGEYNFKSKPKITDNQIKITKIL